MFIYVQHKVGIFLTVFIVIVSIQSFLSFRKFIVGWSVNLAFKQYMCVIHSETGCRIQPIGNIISQPYVEHITTLFIRSYIAISSPVRVLWSIYRICHRPILNRKLATFIEMFEWLNSIKVFTTREQIGGHHRIPILSLRYHILVFLFHIRRT